MAVFPGHWDEHRDEVVVVGATRFRRGMHVGLRPLPDEEASDLEPRTGVIDGIHHDEDGRVYFTVLVDAAPGAEPATSPVYATPSDVEPIET
jgi:hypothetical protein